MNVGLPDGVRLGRSECSDFRYMIYLEEEPNPDLPVPEVTLRLLQDPYHLALQVEQERRHTFSVRKHELPKYAALIGHVLRMHPRFKAGDSIEADADVCERLQPEDMGEYMAYYLQAYLDIPTSLYVGDSDVDLSLPDFFSE